MERSLRTVEEMLLDMHRSLRIIAPGLERFDADEFYFGFVGSGWSPEVRQQRLYEFVHKILPIIVAAYKELAVSSIVFVSDDLQHSGALSLLGLLLYHSEIEGRILRADRVHPNLIKGRPIRRSGERVMILAGDAKDGRSISEHAAKLRSHGAIVPAAFALVGCEDARRFLASEDLHLLSYWTHDERRALLEERARVAA